MTDLAVDDPLRDALVARIGRPMHASGPAAAPDPVNVPMIRHWVDAFEDRNPIYLDDAAARAAGFEGLVAPPAMLQTWTMARPRIEGIRERGGSPLHQGFPRIAPLRVSDRARPRRAGPQRSRTR